MEFSMREFLNLFVCTLLIANCCNAVPAKKYMELRKEMIESEKKYAFGANLTLLGDEIPANQCLMAAKHKEVDDAFQHPMTFLPAKNFLFAREDIKHSEVFKMIRKMPKGALFHAHSSSIVTIDHIIEHISYEPNLYVCIQDNKVKFKFCKTPTSDCPWKLLKNLREKDAGINEKIRNYLVMLQAERNDINDIWDEFENIFDAISGLIRYRPVFEKYFYAAMQELYDDNVMLMEIRTSLGALYELDGTTLDVINVTRVYKEVSDRFVNDHPDFIGAKVIYAPYRGISQQTFDKYVETYKKAKAAYPEFIIGFDLVGQEDKGHTLLNFADKLQALSHETTFFFHAGETNWYGHSTDENLFDAVLLNTKRIGHGYALTKHPRLLDIVKQRHIAIELNPISNQVLKLVKDMRNHPAAYFFAENYPVVVSSDDPSFWGADGLSFDFYETFVGIMSRDADLKALKQLAINSLIYSGMTPDEQKRAFAQWEKAWLKFVKDLANSPECKSRQ